MHLSKDFQLKDFTLDYCVLKMKAFYSFLQHFETTKQRGQIIAISRYCL